MELQLVMTITAEYFIDLGFVIDDIHKHFAIDFCELLVFFVAFK